MNLSDFKSKALETFRYQYQNNLVYKQYFDLVSNKKIQDIKSIADIPFLPISFFKSHSVVTKNNQKEIFFQSSGTTSHEKSTHYISSKKEYIKSLTSSFDFAFGKERNSNILALLPSYLEQKNSSLIFMVNELMNQNQGLEHGFYIYNFQDLNRDLKFLEKEKKPTILIGVTFAILDFVKEFPMNLNNTIIIETGGMKGRKKEIVRKEVHKILQNSLGVKNIYSEYGMCEMMSQFYSKSNGIFAETPQAKVFVRAISDPFKILDNGKTGAINIIDLSNRESCSFIATDDIGKKIDSSHFEVLGRLDHSDARGCNLMYS